jgi:elongation factor G
VAGVQVGTRRVWKAAEREGLARAVVITGMDKENADFAKVLADIKAAFGKACVPVTLPMPDGKGMADVLAAQAPAGMEDAVAEARTALIEVAAETDDALIEKYLGGEELTPDELARGIENGVKTGKLTPVFACRAKQDVGLVELLEGIGRFFPSPTEKKDAEGKTISADPSAPFVGFVWRSVQDPFVGQLSFVRVLGGTLTGDSEVTNASKGQKERLPSILALRGKTQYPVERAMAGDIVAIPKLKVTEAGDTLCAIGQKTQCPRTQFPSPVMTLAVAAKTQADEDRIGVALGRVSEEDPTLRVERNTETRQTLLSGLGDVHIDVAVESMKSRSNVEVVLSTPKVAYRETVTAKGEGHYKHKKQSGGRGQYGEVYLRVMPLPAGETEWFVDKVVGGVIPNNFIPAVQKGVAEGMQAGGLAGYPVTDVKVELYDGSYHDVDSSEISFKIAGARALKEGMLTAKPVLREPVMKVRVTVPDQYMGDITGDLNHKRGRILGMENQDGVQVVVADVPLAELFKYAAELRSMTAGQGSFEMEFVRYDIVPSNIAQKIIAESKKDKEEKEE